MAIVLYHKKYAETLKQSLERFRLEYPHYADSKITYAGRLDPMAEGLLILLTDYDVHQKEAFLGLPKCYEVSFILGVSTDSYDILGLVDSFNFNIHVTEDMLAHELKLLKKKTSQEYPPYSSKTVQGKALFQWAREGSLSEISIPHRDIKIFCLEHLSTQNFSWAYVYSIIHSSVSRVEGDFRQAQILETWSDVDRGIDSEQKISLVKLRLELSSGTYVRSLVQELGKRLGVGACCIKISRISIGDMHLSEDTGCLRQALLSL